MIASILSRRKLIAPLVAVTVAVTLLALPEASNASPFSPSRTNASNGRVIEEVQTGLNVVGFNSAIAKAHGYKIVTYANGDQQSIPIDPHSRSPKSPILHRTPQGAAIPSSKTTRSNTAG